MPPPWDWLCEYSMAINLLPEQEKRELKRKENWKKIFLILVFILIFLLLLVLILFSLKIYIASKIETLQELFLKKEKEFQEKHLQNFEKEIEEINENLFKIKQFGEKQILITPVLEKVSSLIPNSIYLTNFSFRKIFQEEKRKEEEKEENENEKEKIKILAEVQISGWANNREDLFYFRKAIKKEKGIQEIYFSPSSWVKPKDINFSLSFKINEFFNK